MFMGSKKRAAGRGFFSCPLPWSNRHRRPLVAVAAAGELEKLLSQQFVVALNAAAEKPAVQHAKSTHPMNINVLRATTPPTHPPPPETATPKAFMHIK
jgi:hypothetical protein